MRTRLTLAIMTFGLWTSSAHAQASRDAIAEALTIQPGTSIRVGFQQVYCEGTPDNQRATTSCFCRGNERTGYSLILFAVLPNGQTRETVLERYSKNWQPPYDLICRDAIRYNQVCQRAQ